MPRVRVDGAGVVDWTCLFLIVMVAAQTVVVISLWRSV